jgi:hypothetical protein
MATETLKSSNVVLELVVDGTTHSLSHVGNNFLVARGACNVPPQASAELRISVDDATRTRQVILPDGIPAPGKRAEWR